MSGRLMLAEALGFTVTRTIPSRVLLGVLSGTYKVCGGVVRNHGGQIIAHLVNGVDPLGASNPVGTALKAINTYQLYRIGREVAQVNAGVQDVQIAVSNVGSAVVGVQRSVDEVKATVGGVGENVVALQSTTNNLIGLATGTMVLSGLTLAVSAAGFAFLNRKLNAIDAKLLELQKVVKEIKAFLDTKQRSELIDALRTLARLDSVSADDTRKLLITQCRQVFGRLNQHYKTEFERAANEGVISASEEYFTLSALAHARCWAELDVLDTANADMEESYYCWAEVCRKVAKEKLLRADPERLLGHRYAGAVRADEIVDWMEFAHEDEKGLLWLDGCRCPDPRVYAAIAGVLVSRGR